MPGARIHYRKGPHYSRQPKTEAIQLAEIEKALAAFQRIGVNRVEKTDLSHLLIAMAQARIEDREKDRLLTARKERVTGNDVRGQLLAMKNEKTDEGLLKAIQSCDVLTLQAIEEASEEIIWRTIQYNGVFVDCNGDEYTGVRQFAPKNPPF